jgi:hypothetical protein
MTVGRGTPFDSLFASLTEKMGVLHTATPDTDPSQADRCEWADAGLTGLEPIGYTMPGTVTIGRQGIEYQVSIYGASKLEVFARASQLAGWLDYFVGPPQGAAPPPGYEDGWIRHGYKIGRTSVPVQGGDGAAAGYGCALPVTLYQPVYAAVKPTLTVGQVDFTATAEADASTDEADMAASITE